MKCLGTLSIQWFAGPGPGRERLDEALSRLPLNEWVSRGYSPSPESMAFERKLFQGHKRGSTNRSDDSEICARFVGLENTALRFLNDDVVSVRESMTFVIVVLDIFRC